jgi:hypothetical protein
LFVEKVDDKGMNIMPKRKMIGLRKRVMVINASDHLKLIPLPTDPSIPSMERLSWGSPSQS